MPKRPASDALEQPPVSPKRPKFGALLPQSLTREDTFASSQRPPRTKSTKRPASDISGGEDLPESLRATKRPRTATAPTRPPHITAGLPNSRHSLRLNEQPSETSEAAYWQRRTQEINEAFETAERRFRRARHAHATFRMHRLPSPISDIGGSLSPDMDRHHIISEAFELEYSDGPGSLIRRLGTPGVTLQPQSQHSNIWCPPVFDPDWSPARTSQPARTDARTEESQDRPSHYKHPTPQHTGPNLKTNVANKGTPSTIRSKGGKVIQQSRRSARQPFVHKQRRHRVQGSASSQGQPEIPERRRNHRQIPRDMEQVRRSTRSHRMDNVFYELDSRGNPRSISVTAFLRHLYTSDFG